MSTLEFHDVHVSYGKVSALRGINITVGEGEIVALLGNNGAGKTTTLSTASGLVRAKQGTIRFDGKLIDKAQPWDVVGAGLIHCPEGRRIFSTMTVMENLVSGAYLVKDKTVIQSRLKRVFELLPLLDKRKNQQGGTLSGGEQQMLAMGRALLAGPKMLMLDEPSMGLAPLMVAQIMDVVREVNNQGTTVLLVEQNARAALKIAHRGYVIDGGQTSLEGTSQELSADPRVVEAYLGA